MGAEFSPRKGSLGAQWGARSSTWRHWTSHLWAWGGGRWGLQRARVRAKVRKAPVIRQMKLRGPRDSRAIRKLWTQTE